MFFHSLEDFVGLEDVGIGLDVIVCLVDVLILLEQVGAFGSDDMRENAVGV